MTSPTSVRSAAVFGSLACAATVFAATPAAAAAVEFPQVPSLMRNGYCGGAIRSWAETAPEYPGRAIINVQALPIGGLGPGTYSAAPLCETVTTVAWRNVNTGAAGEYRVTVVAGIYGSIQYAQFQDTGPGRVDVTIYTDMPNVPQHGSFVVPAPPPPPAEPAEQ
ncbi:Uncharacterised protein [Nocardia otitidiscaviarum]|uniref:Uncharacterized protein n=1 Tax=Nocardia otitidiscaviarum TaxID=1823 RepID=A0A378Y7Q1_9NOCA|nr:hypothetical protein [Nocardia otitidiscaviarum]SUA73252.1 Uncharacterised protein [Nocardia otitidiscaviarum]